MRYNPLLTQKTAALLQSGRSAVLPSVKADGHILDKDGNIDPNPLGVNSDPSPSEISSNSNPKCAASGVVLKINSAQGGIELWFDTKPSEVVRNQLKGSGMGWRWNGRTGCWYTRDTDYRRAWAEKFIASLGGSKVDAPPAPTAQDDHLGRSSRSDRIDPPVAPVPPEDVIRYGHKPEGETAAQMARNVEATWVKAGADVKAGKIICLSDLICQSEAVHTKRMEEESSAVRRLPPRTTPRWIQPATT